MTALKEKTSRPVRKKKRVVDAGPRRRGQPKKKRVVKKKKRPALPSIEAAQEAVEKITPVDRIRHISRGYKLSFGGLPTQKKLTAKQREKVNRETIKQAERVLSQACKLYDKHPAITAVNSAKGAVLNLFHARTLPYPDPGVRILLLKTDHLDFEKMSEEEIEKDFARQMEQFSAEVYEKLADYEAAVASLQRNWSQVLEAQKKTFEESGLQDLYDPDNYPSPERIPDTLYHNFRPYNIDPPKETNHMSPQERARILKAVEAQLEQAVEMQAQFVVALLHDAINQLIESVNGFHNKEKRSFKNSVVERVFDAFTEFKEKTVKYGILRGSALESEFKRAMDFMTEGLADRHTLPGLLRQSAQKRHDLIEKMQMVSNSLGTLAESRKRRSVIRD